MQGMVWLSPFYACYGLASLAGGPDSFGNTPSWVGTYPAAARSVICSRDFLYQHFNKGIVAPCRAWLQCFRPEKEENAKWEPEGTQHLFLSQTDAAFTAILCEGTQSSRLANTHSVVRMRGIIDC